MKKETNIELRISKDEVVFRRGGNPAAQTGAGFGHRRRSLTLDMQGTVSLPQPAGGVAGPTKNLIRAATGGRPYDGCSPRAWGFSVKKGSGGGVDNMTLILENRVI